MKILTYNISGNSKTFSLEKICKTIPSADVICLQEVCGLHPYNTQAHVIGQILNMKTVFAVAQVFQWGVFGNAILTNLPILNVAFIPLPAGSYLNDNGEIMAGATETRVALIVTVMYNNTEIDCISTHIGLYNSIDIKSTEPVKTISRFSNTSILAGDLNSESIVSTLETDGWTVCKTAPTFKHKVIDYICSKGCELLSQTVILSDASDHNPIIAVYKI